MLKNLKPFLRILPAAIPAILLVGCAKRPVVKLMPVKPLTTAQLQQHYIKELRQQGVLVIELGQTIRLVFPSDQLFTGHSANISDAYKAVLNTAAKLMKTYSKVTVKVAAYSDNLRRGGAYAPKQRKRALTVRQAQVVSRYLWTRGINTRLQYAVGYSRYHTVASNVTAQGRSYNRRVEVSFRFYPENINE